MERRYLSPDVTAEEVLAQLERLKASAPFRSSRRCVLFLDYVIHLALKGEAEGLKERTIGVEVFRRDPNYDTNQDPIVRGTASEIRKRLAQYYQAREHEDELRIELPPGSYLPQVHLPEPVAHVPAKATPLAEAKLELPVLVEPETKRTLELSPVTAPELTASPTPRVSERHALGPVRLWVWVVAAVAALGGLATGALFWNHKSGGSPSPNTAFDQFWAPTLGSTRPVLLVVGQPTVYNVVGPLNETVSKAWKRNNGGRPHEGRVLADIRDIVPSSDRYIALGDATCLADMAAMFARHGRDYRVRSGSSTTFADLRENTSVLIGAFTNDWAMRLAGPLRYTFATTPDNTMHYVHDRVHATDRHWALKDVWPAWDMPVDYAIVSRVLDPTTRSIVVMAAGITHYGTAAAGEFLTNSEYLDQAFGKAEPGWQSKNLQIVLATKVIGSTAGPPEILAVSVQ